MGTLLCLATAIFFEARGESFDGQLAVGQVIQNRVELEYAENTCKVIVAEGQFSFVKDGEIPSMFVVEEPRAWVVSFIAATKVLNGEVDIVPTSTHFHTPGVSPSWSQTFKKDGRIGNHIFYTETS